MSTPGAAGDFQHLVGEGESARIHDVLHADRSQQVSLLGRAGGHGHLGPREPREVNGRHADAAGRRVDQHAFALRMRPMWLRRNAPARYATGKVAASSKLQCGGFFAQKRCSVSVKAPKVKPASHDIVARLDVFDPCTDGGHRAGALVAERNRAIGQAGVDAERLHHVAEVQARWPRVNFHLAGSGHRAVTLVQPQPVEHARDESFPTGTALSPMGR